MPIITRTLDDIYGLAKRPFTVTTEKCMSEDETREAVKGHTECTSLLLRTNFTSSTDRTFRLLEGF